jgi:hypothetical protein
VAERTRMQRNLFAIAGIAALLALAGCTNPNGPTGDYGSVAGMVTDARTGTPIASAQVCIFVVDCQTTAADGTYKISTVPSDPAGVLETITASASGYTSASQQVHITSGQQTPANFALNHT